MSATASVQAHLDAQIERLTKLGLVPVNVVLSYTDHWRLSYQDLGGPDVGYPRPRFPYQSFVPSYRGLAILRPGLAYDGAPTVGVRL